jgi:outer membrane protein
MLFAFALNLEAKELKMAVVDMQRVLREYGVTRQMLDEAKRKEQSYRKEITEKQRRLKDLQKDYDARKDKAKGKELEELKGRIEQEKKELDALVKKAASEGAEDRKRFDEKKAEILKKTAEYAKSKGYNFIFDERSLIHFDTAADITEDVLKSLK